MVCARDFILVPLLYDYRPLSTTVSRCRRRACLAHVGIVYIDDQSRVSMSTSTLN